MSKVIRYAGADLYPKQRAAIFDPARIVLVEASTKAGKLAPLDSIVYTPRGPKKMGEIQIGDDVLTPDGRTAPVVGVYPQGEQDVYRVTFSDGTSAECGLEHLWEVHADMRDYRRGYQYRLIDGTAPPRRRDYQGWPRVMTLADLLRYSEKRRRRMWVRVTQPVAFDPRTVTIPPYALGALLGDGSFRDNLSLTCVDTQIVARVRAETGQLGELYTRDVATHLYRGAKRLRSEIRDMGLDMHYSHEKFIPDAYRYNTEAVRWAVIQGLMDTDGSVDNKGQPTFEVTSQRLAEDFREIVQSLGGLVRISTKEGSYTKDDVRHACRTVYRCRVTHPNSFAFFTLPRKLARCRVKAKPMTRTFRSIEFSRRTQTQCIEVMHPDGLYMANDFIVTHNTVSCLAWLGEMAMIQGKPERNYWWTAPVYGQADIAFRRMKAKLPRAYYKANQSKLTITLVNGATIWFKSAEQPDNLYGEDVYAVVMDEASRMREAAWHAIRSTLTFTQGPVRMIGNVKGRKNWFYDLARLAESGAEGMAYHRLTAWDAVEAGVLEREEIESAYRDFKRLGREGAFNQLYLAIAADDGDNPFGLDAIDACVVEGLSGGYPKAAGVDLAGRGAVNLSAAGPEEVADRDYTAIVMLDRDGAATHISRFRKGHTETAAEVARVVRGTMALVDSTGTGDAIVEALQKRGDLRVTGYTFTERSRQDLLEGLALAIGEGSVSFPDGWMRDELDAFEYSYSARGIRFSAPDGAHDDGAMALALAVKRLPRRRNLHASPMGVPKAGGSAWTGDGEQAERGLLGEQQAPNPEVGSSGTPVPMVVGGSGLSRWNGGQ